jgi:L-ascorbate metabolism protein UlaG (beta-lactamase superfamily)
MIELLVVVTLFVVIVLLFLNYYPSLGGNPSKRQVENFKTFKNYHKGRFQNQTETKMSMSFSSLLSMVKDLFVSNPNRSPKHPFPVSQIDWEKIYGTEDSITWFGHSTFLVSVDGKKILFDPIFSHISSPVSFVGSKRYSQDIFYLIDGLPKIDAVVISHDHYDHMDHQTVIQLKEKTSHFFVPCGVGAHLEKWGISDVNFTELNWWDELEWNGLKIVATPSRHFSGRGLFNRDTTLWSSWIIESEGTKIFFSGDGGYGQHFKEIGEKFGPFDLTLIEGGQYDERWGSIHMFPEQSVQAHLDLKGKTMVLMHWGAFTLAYHSWTDPIERAIVASKENAVELFIPSLCETESIPTNTHFSNQWWKEKS